MICVCDWVFLSSLVFNGLFEGVVFVIFVFEFRFVF